MDENLDIQPVTEENKKQFIELYNLLSPQGTPTIIERSTPSWYYMRLVFVGKRPVALICVNTIFSTGDPRIPDQTPYLYFLGVKPMYRLQGIGTLLLTRCMDYLRDVHNADAIYLHVQKGNEFAISLYQRLNFNVIATIPRYYRRLECEDAFIMMCKLKN